MRTRSAGHMPSARPRCWNCGQPSPRRETEKTSGLRQGVPGCSCHPAPSPAGRSIRKCLSDLYLADSDDLAHGLPEGGSLRDTSVLIQPYTDTLTDATSAVLNESSPPIPRGLHADRTPRRLHHHRRARRHRAPEAHTEPREGGGCRGSQRPPQPHRGTGDASPGVGAVRGLPGRPRVQQLTGRGGRDRGGHRSRLARDWVARSRHHDLLDLGGQRQRAGRRRKRARLPVIPRGGSPDRVGGSARSFRRAGGISSPSVVATEAREFRPPWRQGRRTRPPGRRRAFAGTRSGIRLVRPAVAPSVSRR